MLLSRHFHSVHHRQRVQAVGETSAASTLQARLTPISDVGSGLALRSDRSVTEWQRWQERRGADTRHCAAALGPAEFARTPKLARLEAVLFVADGPLTLHRLVQFATLADPGEARELVQTLNNSYERDGAAFRIERVASGYQMLTLPLYADWLDRLHQRHSALKLSPPAMETLTIVAYRQPIIRADIEAIRGVQSTEMLKQLMERGLVRIGGEDDSLGRPYLYVTTRKFLELFGLKSLDDLPMADSLRRPAGSQSVATQLEQSNAEQGEEARSTQVEAAASETERPLNEPPQADETASAARADESTFAPPQPPKQSEAA